MKEEGSPLFLFFLSFVVLWRRRERQMHACLGLRRSKGERKKKKRGKGPLKKKGPLFIFGEKKAAGGKATGTMLYTVPFFLPFLFLSSCEGRAKLCFFLQDLFSPSEELILCMYTMIFQKRTRRSLLCRRPRM